MADPRDINKPGGWLVRVTTPGGPSIKRHFKVYELDKAAAEGLAKSYANAAPGETVEAIKQLNIHEFTGDAMAPGQVKQHG